MMSAFVMLLWWMGPWRAFTFDQVTCPMQRTMQCPFILVYIDLWKTSCKVRHAQQQACGCRRADYLSNWLAVTPGRLFHITQFWWWGCFSDKCTSICTCPSHNAAQKHALIPRTMTPCLYSVYRWRAIYWQPSTVLSYSRILLHSSCVPVLLSSLCRGSMQYLIRKYCTNKL